MPEPALGAAKRNEPLVGIAGVDLMRVKRWRQKPTT
jgi:hypothetical protein